MYSFAQRADTRVVDEPLYAHYLRVSGAEHPGRADVLRAQDQEGERVVRDLMLAGVDRDVHFQKQMAHHLMELDWGFLERTCNVLLVRDPREMLPSFAVNIERPTLHDTGLALQTRLLEHLQGLGQEPAVLDARILLEDPRGVLRRLGEHISIPWDESMLTWNAGAPPEHGVWARHWYTSVHASTGFAPYRPKTAPLAADLEPVLAECLPHYEVLLAQARRFATN